MKQFVPSRSPCPIGRASRVLGDRWVLLVLREAMLGVTRFDDFITRTGINRAALTSRLALLIEAGLLERVPPDARRADYRLTDAGRALEPTLTALRDWGDRHLPIAGEASRR
jgi:DNA-binding HxlR family transcriptional regulator